MVPSSNISIQKTLYEVLSVGEDATYDEIRAAYKSAALNTHPDKAHPTPVKKGVPSAVGSHTMRGLGKGCLRTYLPAQSAETLDLSVTDGKTLPLNPWPSSEQQEFVSVQKAWEILRHPASRADYDKKVQSSRQNIEIIASEIEVEDMIVQSIADTVELLYPCRCGDYFSITSCELGEMGILVKGDGEVEHQAPDSASASIVLGCGSCSLKVRLVINEIS